MFLSFEAESPPSSGLLRTAAPRAENNKFSSNSEGRYHSAGELALIFRMTKCGAGRKAIAQKCAACVKDRRKVDMTVSATVLIGSANIPVQPYALVRGVRTWERCAIRVRNPR